MENSKVAAIIVTYNRSEVIQKTLDCLQAQTYPISNIIVVDNNSSDNTIAGLLERKNHDARISIVSSSENIGYGSGLALGMDWALKNTAVDYMWLMDDDVSNIPETLGYLVENSKKYNYDALGLMGYKLGLGTKTKVNPINHSEDVDFMPVDHALLNIEAIKKVGVPSSDFFMMCEDYEYCLRIKKAGLKLGVIANNHVNRLAMGGGERFSRSTRWRGYYHSRNHLLILKQYFSWFRFASYVIVQSKYLIAGLLAPDRLDRIKFRLMGIYHGLQSVKGKTLDPITLTFKKRN